jgi:hypothetical protein
MNIASNQPISSLYLHSPSLEYRQVFSQALQRDEFHNEPILAAMSSVVHMVELLKRCHLPLHILSSDEFDAAQFTIEAQRYAWGPMHAVSPGASGTTYTSLVWAEPEVHSITNILQIFERLAAPGAILSIISSGPLRRFLPAWKDVPTPARQPLSPGKVVRLISAFGWKIDRQVAFHGPRSIFWSLLWRVAEGLGRPDWADRCLFAVRRAYQEPGWLWAVSTVTLIQAHKI